MHQNLMSLQPNKNASLPLNREKSFLLFFNVV